MKHIVLEPNKTLTPIAGNGPRPDLSPHVGYFAWIGGIFLIVGWDLWDEVAKYVTIDY